MRKSKYEGIMNLMDNEWIIQVIIRINAGNGMIMHSRGQR